MELQQIIVIAIVCLCTIWISIRIFQYFKRIKNNSNPCECCNSDCAMKSMHNKPKCGCEKMQKSEKKIAKYLQIKKMSYLCNRNRETKIDNNKVPWMSGLVSGLQNRVRRFESARNLLITSKINMQKGIIHRLFPFAYNI